jgi:hypothetical protein
MLSGVLLEGGWCALYIHGPLVRSLANAGHLPGFDQRREQLVEIGLGGFCNDPEAFADGDREIASRIDPPLSRHQVSAADPAFG